MSADKLAQGVSVELPSQLKMGQQAQAKAKLAYMGGRYELRGGWSSSNPAVLSVDANGTVTAHNEGTARITISAQGQSFSTSVQISAVSLAFNANGGSGSTQAVKGAGGAKVTGPAFAGCCTGRTGGSRFDFTTPVTGNMT